MKQMEHGGSTAGAHSDSAGHQHGTDVPSDIKARSQIDTSTTQESNKGHYRVSISPEADPVAINTMQSWVLEVMTPDGKPVQNAEVKVDGGMPRHGHGLPTSPQVTKYLGDGKYLVEGMRFNMAGWWALKFDIAGHHTDSVNFNLIIQ
ncbi:MAG: FixH family protein [Alphaproteobacteria bacterium]|nr:FixH family protein [Alphaproteobacteria bacterium]